MLLVIPTLLSFFLLKQEKSLRVKVLEALALLMLVLALAQPVTKKEIIANGVIVAVDRSASITPELIANFKERLAKLALPTDTKYLSFAGGLGTLESSLSDAYQGSIDQLKASNFENLINYFPQTPLVLLSDGQENSGNALTALQLRGRDAPVYPIVLDGEEIIAGFEIKKLTVPLLSDAGIKQDLSLLFKNFTAGQVSGKIVIKQEDQVLKEEEKELSAQEVLNYSFTTNELKSGLNKFSVEFKDANILIEQLVFYITGKEKNQVLILTSSQAETKILERALVEQKYQIVTQDSSQQAVAVDDLSKFQIIFLNNIPFKDLPNKLVDSLTTYLKEGGALMMLGGNKSFGLGGYKGTIVEDVLPVDLLEPEKIKQRVNVAVSLVLDKSGSMRTSQRMDYTKLASRSVIDALKDDDYFGLIGFDNQPFIALNMQQLTASNRDKATKRVDLLFPNGGTSLYPAMDVARQELELAKAGRKHMIILTDGRLPDEAQLGTSYVNLARELKAINISVSTFLIGSDDSKLLKEIASFGGGTFHQTMDAQSLPRLFLDDVRINTAEKTQKEFSEYPVKKDKSSVGQITKLTDFPSLLGYVETKVKKEAQLELVTTAVNDDPILAGWNYKGGGRVVAFTSDLSGRWSKNWIGWKSIYDFLEQVLAYLTPTQDGRLFSDFDFDYLIKGQRLQLNLTTYQSAFQVGDFPLHITWADNSEEDLSFLTINKGYYQADLQAPVAGLAKIKLGTPDGRDHQFMIDIPNPDEVEKPMGINQAFLSSLASLSGGEVNPTEIKATATAESKVVEKSWQAFFLLLSLVLILASICSREGIFSRK